MTELILLILLVCGTAAYFYEELVSARDAVRARVADWYETLKRKDELEQAGSAGRAADDRVTHHILTLLEITMGIGTEKGCRVFLSFCGICGGAAVLFFAHRISPILVVLTAMLGMSFPYALLRLKLQKMRTAASREGEILIVELLENYKICNCNMRQTIDVTAQSIQEAPHARRLLFSLAKGLNRGTDDRETEQLVEEFRLSIHTSWANVLAANLYFALTSGMRIVDALEDLADTMVRARKVDEYAKRENHEAGLMLKYLAPVCYLLTVIGGIFYFGLSPSGFLFYQFGTKVGLSWLVISILLYGSGLLVHGFISRGKLDL